MMYADYLEKVPSVDTTRASLALLARLDRLDDAEHFGVVH